MFKFLAIKKPAVCGLFLYQNEPLFRVHQGNGHVQHTVREAPLVVVPRADFHEGAAGDFG